MYAWKCLQFQPVWNFSIKIKPNKPFFIICLQIKSFENTVGKGAQNEQNDLYWSKKVLHHLI